MEIPRISSLEGEKLDFVSTQRLEKVLTEMVMDHAVRRDLFLVCIHQEQRRGRDE